MSRLVHVVTAGTASLATLLAIGRCAEREPFAPARTVVDPTLLPRAVGQRPADGAYGRTLAAGRTYVDPNTGVTVLKLTDARTPEANGGMYHGYSEGGPSISQPWVGADGSPWYTLRIGEWLVDVREGSLGAANWRRHPGRGEIGFAFSLDPATPRMAYIADWDAKRIHRYDTASGTVADDGNWPWIISAAGDYPDWLQSQVGDTWLVAMLNSDRTVVAFRPRDGMQRVLTSARGGVNQDEPHLDRERPVVYLSGDRPPEQKIWNLESDDFTIPQDPGEFNQDSHTATLRGKAVAVGHWKANAIVATTWQGQVSAVVAPSATAVTGDYHLAGQWVFGNPQEYFAVDQWRSADSARVMLGMIGLASASGSNDVRILAASDATGTAYGEGGQPHPTFAPDGRFVMWTSNMHGSGRWDVFLARLPAR